MRKFILMFVVAATVGFACSGNVYAESNVHDGFFLRLAPGIGFNETTSDIAGSSLKMSGASGLFNFAIGGAVAQDLILHLDVSGVSTSNPKVSVNGSTLTTNVSSSTTTLVGIGATYYMQSNYYLTGAFGIAKSTNTSYGIDYSTNNGLGVNLMVGKEWWVSDDWGLGIAGQFLFTKCPDGASGGGNPDVKSTSIGLLFSATYN